MAEMAIQSPGFASSSLQRLVDGDPGRRARAPAGHSRAREGSRPTELARRRIFGIAAVGPCSRSSAGLSHRVSQPPTQRGTAGRSGCSRAADAVTLLRWVTPGPIAATSPTPHGPGNEKGRSDFTAPSLQSAACGRCGRRPRHGPASAPDPGRWRARGPRGSRGGRPGRGTTAAFTGLRNRHRRLLSRVVRRQSARSGRPALTRIKARAPIWPP